MEQFDHAAQVNLIITYWHQLFLRPGEILRLCAPQASCVVARPLRRDPRHDDQSL